MDAFCVHYGLWTNAARYVFIARIRCILFPLTACHKLMRCSLVPCTHNLEHGIHTKSAQIIFAI